jgi:tyrosinase
MVRIRKNANGLSNGERDRYLAALKTVSAPASYDSYINFVKTHSRDSTGSVGAVVSHRQAHSGSAFLPWHRIFVLHMERLLQAADPSVALPYWKFDDNAPNIFTPAFMGANSAGNMATLVMTNPISSWALPADGVAGIQRKTPYGDSGHPTVATELATLGLGSPTFNYSAFKTMEGSAHNPAHSTSGFTNPMTGQPLPGASWVAGSPAIAPRDPLFFLLHSNVDRLWAKWQWLRTRYTLTDVAAYDLQGSHATPAVGVATPAFTQNMNGQITANRTLGQYADDTLWPWDAVTGGTGTAARPDIAILTPLPITLGGVFPFAMPTVKSTIDYLGITGTSPGGSQGFAYDDFFPY